MSNQDKPTELKEVELDQAAGGADAAQANATATQNIGSQSTGAGAGRVTFNPFSVDRK